MVQEMLCHYPRNHFRAKKPTQTSKLKTFLKKQPEKAISQCCSMKEKDEKSELRRIWKELEKAALAPRNALTRSAKFAQIFRKSSPEFNPFLVSFFSIAFEDALPQKVPKMFCSYPRKHFRAKKHAQTALWKQAWTSNLKTPFPTAVLFKKRTKNRS